MFAPPAGFPQPGSLTSPSCRNPFCYGYLCLCNAQMFISIYFLKVSFKKEQGASSSSFNHNTRSRFGLYCFLRRTSRFSTMQHFKVLLLLLFVAAVSISLTQAWVLSNKKVGKRDIKEPAREENRRKMDDGAARLKERRFHVEEWDRA